MSKTLISDQVSKLETEVRELKSKVCKLEVDGYFSLKTGRQFIDPMVLGMIPLTEEYPVKDAVKRLLDHCGLELKHTNAVPARLELVKKEDKRGGEDGE